MSNNFFDNWKSKTGDGHKRYQFTPSFSIVPEDYSLATDCLADIPSVILETFSRFYRVGWIAEHGDKCFLMSHLLRRILRLHGVEAHVKQLSLAYEKKDRGWYCEIGGFSDRITAGEIDSHMVCLADGFILDLALLRPIHYEFGAMAPVACITKYDPEKFGEFVDTGFFGSFCYSPRSPHPLTKHWVYEQRDHEKQLVQEYFKIYKM